tara:strand:+ start:190 stop:693 length:504 start_codon:yes stop_codon:yes gene_type:complete
MENEFKRLEDKKIQKYIEKKLKRLEDKQTYLKLRKYLENKLGKWKALQWKLSSKKYKVYRRVKLMRQIYLYVNRYIQKNKNIIENSNTTFMKLFKTMLKKSIEVSSQIPGIISEHDYDYTELRWIQIAHKNIRRYQHIYYERKAFVATTLRVKLPNDLCRKITDYLY